MELESLTAEVQKREQRLRAAEASAAAEKRSCKLWQKKLETIAEQLATVQGELQTERTDMKGLREALGEIKQQANKSNVEAKAYKKVMLYTFTIEHALTSGCNVMTI